MRISDIAIKEVYCAAPTTSLVETASMMKRHNVGLVPICEGKKLVGVVTDRDIVINCVAAGMDAARCNAKEFMTSNPILVTPDTNIEEAAKIMGKEQIHRLPVVDNGNLVGVVSLGDLAIALTRNDSLLADTLRKISIPTQAIPVC
jgi:CBS domain-containing protein